MQSSYWGYWLVVMGVAIVGLMISVNGLTTTSTQDYYGVKEVVEASMLESVDYGYYRDYNEVKMNKEKFMEVFVRMIAESMSSTDTYEVNFYEIYEAPPKVSVEVKSNSGTNFISNGEYDVTTRVDAVIQIHAEQVGDPGSSKPVNPSDTDSGNLGAGTDVNQGNNNQNNNNNNNNNNNVNNNGGAVPIKTCDTEIVSYTNNNIFIVEDENGNEVTTLSPGRTYTIYFPTKIYGPLSTDNDVNHIDLAGSGFNCTIEEVGIKSNENVLYVNGRYTNSDIDTKFNVPFTKFDTYQTAESFATIKVPYNYSGKTLKFTAYLKGIDKVVTEDIYLEVK